MTVQTNNILGVNSSKLTCQNSQVSNNDLMLQDTEVSNAILFRSILSFSALENITNLGYQLDNDTISCYVTTITSQSCC